MPIIKSSNILVENWLNIARDKNTVSEVFKNAIENIGLLLFSEAINDVKGVTVKKGIKTPLKGANVNFIVQKNIFVVPVLRAGLSMLAGIRNFVPEAKVAHVGLYRNENTLKPVWYLNKLPRKADIKSIFFILEPMLATGGTISTVLQKIINLGAIKIKVLSALISEPARIKLEESFPMVSFYVAGIDPELNSKGYIVPGLGDAGDRAFNL